jgi:hypothetical protein
MNKQGSGSGPKLSSDELDSFGHALSTLVQQRYVWLFSHIVRAVFLDLIDRKALNPCPERYFFSEEDQQKGAPAVVVSLITDLVHSRTGVFAYSPDGSQTYDYNYAREITRTGIRGSFLVTVQSYLEFFRIESIAKRRGLTEAEELLTFIRQARNIVCHANGNMSSDRLKRCAWRGITIEKSDRIFKLTDQWLLQLVEDAIEMLARIYTANGRQVDYVSLNLGYGIPAIQVLANKARDSGADKDQ